MLRSRTRNQRHHPMDPPEQTWPDETIVVLPETPRVRLSPRRKMDPQSPGWPPAYMGETIRMYHDPEDQEETVNFAMNPDFIESKTPFFEEVLMRHAFIYSDLIANQDSNVVTFESSDCS
jgi:hypothetical protein